MINVIAVALITIGYSRAKKLEESRNRFRSIYMFYGIAFILILSRIPWNAWLN
jgi:multisubunit Na+/H+ antiporter MnhB subunit